MTQKMLKKESSPLLLYFFLLAMTLLFIFIFFKNMEASLFYFESVYSLQKSAGIYFKGFFAHTFLLFLYKNLFKKIHFKVIAFELFLFFFFTLILPLLLFLVKPQKSSMSFLWVPLEWHKLPLNLFLILQSISSYFLVFTLATLFLLWLYIVKCKTRLVITFHVIIAILVLHALFKLGAWQRVSAYIVIFEIPLCVSIFAARRGYLRVFTYFSFYNLISLTLILFYIGVIPIETRHYKPLPTGVELFYPFKEGKINFQLEFLRAFYVDEKRNYLFATFGPTSGIARLSLTGEKEDILQINSVLRYVWSDAQRDELYAIDWQNADIVVVSKSKLKILKKVNIFDHALVAPMNAVVRKNKMYIGSIEYPAVTAFHLKTLKKTKQISFRGNNVTPFRSGTGIIALDPSRDKLIAEIGMVNPQNIFILLLIDLKRFIIEKSVTIKEGGITLLPIKEKDSLLVPAFYSETISEYDLKTLTFKRNLKGPLNTRSIHYDPKRNLLYAASFSVGTVSAIDYESGHTIKKIRLGNKIHAMCMFKKQDALFVGTAQGIYKIHLKEFLHE